MRWWLLVVCLAVGCGKGTPQKPSAADLQVELAILDRMEKDLAEANRTWSMGLDSLASAPGPESDALGKSLDELSAAIDKKQAAVKAQRELIERMQEQRR